MENQTLHWIATLIHFLCFVIMYNFENGFYPESVVVSRHQIEKTICGSKQLPSLCFTSFIETHPLNCRVFIGKSTEEEVLQFQLNKTFNLGSTVKVYSRHKTQQYEIYSMKSQECSLESPGTPFSVLFFYLFSFFPLIVFISLFQLKSS